MTNWRHRGDCHQAKRRRAEPIRGDGSQMCRPTHPTGKCFARRYNVGIPVSPHTCTELRIVLEWPPARTIHSIVWMLQQINHKIWWGKIIMHFYFFCFNYIPCFCRLIGFILFRFITCPRLTLWMCFQYYVCNLIVSSFLVNRVGWVWCRIKFCS